MAEHTANYNLEKQQENEFIDIQGINSNFDIIDAQLKKNNQDNYRPNMLINGDFQIWQRGESFDHTSIAGRFYTADRWCAIRGSLSAGAIVAKNGEYLNITGSNDGKGASITQSIESTVGRKCRGKKITLSLKVKSSVNSSADIILAYSNAGEYIPGQSPTGIIAKKSIAITPSFAIFEVTGIVPDDAQGLYITIDYTGSGSATLTYEYIKLEVNDHATPFIPRSYGEELELCKRYYEAGDVSFALAKGVVYEPLSKFNVEKRITPTLTYQAPTDVNNIPIAQIVGATYPRTTTVGAIELSGVAQYPIINIKYTADAEI